MSDVAKNKKKRKTKKTKILKMSKSFRILGCMGEKVRRMKHFVSSKRARVTEFRNCLSDENPIFESLCHDFEAVREHEKREGAEKETFYYSNTGQNR